MITLFDWLSKEALDLKYSLETAGFHSLTVVLSDDGSLPDGFTSPYSFFCGMENQERHPVYFNQVAIPTLWQITGTNGQAEIWNHSDKMGNIYYHEPKHKRYVKDVDWLDRSGKVRYTSHYNQYGWIFAKTYFNQDQTPVIKKYFDQTGKEVLSENLQTGTHLLYWKDKVYVFDKKLSFFQFYLKESQLDVSRIWYNSLSTPFFLSYYMNQEGEDVLFWQEKITTDIPANMRLILEDRTQRTKKVIFQDKESYERAKDLLGPEEGSKIDYLGYLYPSERENGQGKEILILTNSDNIQSLGTLVEGLKDFNFHIGALTEMSQQLMSFGQYSNVTLYPNISHKMVQKLYDLCDVYLDINHGNEILSAVRTAFEHNHLILGFNNTIHNQTFMIESHVFEANEPEEMIMFLNGIEDMGQLVENQRERSGQSTVGLYQEKLPQFE